MIGASRNSPNRRALDRDYGSTVEAGINREPRQRNACDVLRQAFERAGIEFIDENGGGPGVRLRKRHRLKKPK